MQVLLQCLIVEAERRWICLSSPTHHQDQATWKQYQLLVARRQVQRLDIRDLADDVTHGHCHVTSLAREADAEARGMPSPEDGISVDRPGRPDPKWGSIPRPHDTDAQGLAWCRRGH